MPTRNGKIANLPNDIREQLNLRFLDGETGRELAAWLNALPAVQSVLGSQFNGSPISEVNLTHWRQGGYLQWLTERECFDSARALADGDCNLAQTGLSAERLLNVLTVRFGELLMRWDFSPDEGVANTVAFSEVARKARILQGISRAVLAIHRIQSQPACKKSEPSASPATSRASSEEHAVPSLPREMPAETRIEAGLLEEVLVSQSRKKESQSEIRRGERGGASGEHGDSRGERRGAGGEHGDSRGERGGAGGEHGDSRANPKSTESRDSGMLGVGKGKGRAVPQILSGPIIPASIPLVLPQTPFKADLDPSEILAAV